LHFRFWDNDWQTSWENAKKLPEGIEISFTSKRFSEIRRVFLVSAGEVIQ